MCPWLSAHTLLDYPHVGCNNAGATADDLVTVLVTQTLSPAAASSVLNKGPAFPTLAW